MRTQMELSGQIAELSLQEVQTEGGNKMKKFVRWMIGQIARGTVAILVAIAIMYLNIDWMARTFQPISAISVLAFISSIIGAFVYAWLDSMVTVKK